MVDREAAMTEQRDMYGACLEECRPLQVAYASIVQIDDETGRDGGNFGGDGDRSTKRAIDFAAKFERDDSTDAGRQHLL